MALSNEDLRMLEDQEPAVWQGRVVGTLPAIGKIHASVHHSIGISPTQAGRVLVSTSGEGQGPAGRESAIWSLDASRCELRLVVGCLII